MFVIFLSFMVNIILYKNLYVISKNENVIVEKMFLFLTVDYWY